MLKEITKKNQKEKKITKMPLMLEIILTKEMVNTMK